MQKFKSISWKPRKLLNSSNSDIFFLKNFCLDLIIYTICLLMLDAEASYNGPLPSLPSIPATMFLHCVLFSDSSKSRNIQGFLLIASFLNWSVGLWFLSRLRIVALR